MVATAAPASAHTVGGEHATNYRTRVLSLSPATAGVALRVIEHGDRLELTNSTQHNVVVLGYDDESYLRVGPRGVFENRRSPATYLNRTRLGTDRPPASADASASPDWRRVSGGGPPRRHGPPAPPVGSGPPPAGARAPPRPH